MKGDKRINDDKSENIILKRNYNFMLMSMYLLSTLNESVDWVGLQKQIYLFFFVLYENTLILVVNTIKIKESLIFVLFHFVRIANTIYFREFLKLKCFFCCFFLSLKEEILENCIFRFVYCECVMCNVYVCNAMCIFIYLFYLIWMMMKWFQLHIFQVLFQSYWIGSSELYMFSVW